MIVFDLQHLCPFKQIYVLCVCFVLIGFWDFVHMRKIWICLQLSIFEYLPLCYNSHQRGEKAFLCFLLSPQLYYCSNRKAIRLFFLYHSMQTGNVSSTVKAIELKKSNLLNILKIWNFGGLIRDFTAAVVNGI